ncbi:hypothetical protein BLSTO_01845 [Blastocystis sp. subtype 1]
MSQQEKGYSLKQLTECNKRFVALVEEYESLLETHDCLLQKAPFYKMLSLASKRDYLYPIRLHYSTFVYNCGMLEEKCMQLVLSLDGVESFGEEYIRRRRRQLVMQIENLSKYSSALTVTTRPFVNALEEVEDSTQMV